MKTNIKQRNIKIIAEVHPQHMGSIYELERMILQCKMGGADFVKVQLYSSQNLFNNNDRNFLELKKDEYNDLRAEIERLEIEVSVNKKDFLNDESGSL